MLTSLINRNEKKIILNQKPSWFERNTYRLLISPTVILLLAIFVFPIVLAVIMSFQHITLRTMNDPPFVGIDNYTAIFQGDRLLNSTKVTFYNLGLVVTGSLTFGLVLALVYHQKFWGRGIARTFAVIPMMLTPAALALIMKTMYHPTVGVFNYWLELLGIKPYLWTYSQTSVIPAVALIQVYQYSPLAMLFALGGLASLPTEPYEAAIVDGANWWQTFWYLTLPLLRPHLFVCALILTIDVMKQFDIIWIMSAGGPGIASETFNILLYKKAWSFYRWGEAAAFGMVFLFLMVIITLIFLRYRRSEKY